MKKIFGFLLILILVGSVFAGWIVLGSATGFDAPRKYLYIRPEAATKKAVMDSLMQNHLITNDFAFEFLANRFNYWNNIKPGKYEIKKGNSLLTIIRKLKNGQQEDVDLVINKLRTKEDFAKLVGKKFATDSAQMMNFLNSEDSLKAFDTHPEEVMCLVLPDTYAYFWNSTPSVIFQKIAEESKNFWNEDRVEKARRLNLAPKEVCILASIVEEETTNNSEKDTIASVYLNRLRINMRLQADPTLKFAVKDFTLKRIAGPILDVESPYNTYRNTGLPPGPICTPSRITLDAVLNPAQTNYLYFVANGHLNGHLFSADYAEHVKKAQSYHEEDKKRLEKQNQAK